MSARAFVRAVAAAIVESAPERPSDARDWQGITEDLNRMTDKLRDSRGREEQLRDTAERERTTHASVTKALRQHNADLRSGNDALRHSIGTVTAQNTALLTEIKDLKKVELAAAVGALRAILAEITRLLPARQLIDDDNLFAPFPKSLRLIRNHAQRGLQNDPVFLREEADLVKLEAFRREIDERDAVNDVDDRIRGGSEP